MTNPTLNYNQFGAPPSNAASSTGCTNSIVSAVTGGHRHDMGGSSASTPNGSSPAAPAGTATFWNDLAGGWYRTEWICRFERDTQVTPAGYYGALQGVVRNAAGTGSGSTWYAGLQSWSSVPGSNADALISRVRAELRGAIGWLGGAKGFLGEMGWPKSVDSASWNALAEVLYDELDAAGIWATAWSTGSWWGTGYNLAAYEDTGGTDGVDTARNPATIIEAHPSSGSAPWTTGYGRGINVAGGEFNDSVLPGTYDVNYHYDSQATFDFLASRGIKLVRLPIRWERLQRSLNGVLDSGEVTRIGQLLDRVNNAGLVGILDIHNYGGYKISGVDNKIGGGTVTQAHFNDLMTRLVNSTLWSKPALLALGMMNEPNGIPSVAGTFTPNGSGYVENFNSSIGQWHGSGTFRVNTTTPINGAGSMRNVYTWPAGDQTMRIDNGVIASTDRSANGLTYRIKARIPTGGATGVEARLEVNAGNADRAGSYVTLVPGTVHELTVTITSAQATDVEHFSIQMHRPSSSAGGSVTVDFDDLEQGTLSGALTGAQHWQQISQNALNAIRTAEGTGAHKLIMIPLESWSGAQNAQATHPGGPWIIDSANNFRYEFHFYMDRDNSGDFPDTYSSEVTNAQGRGYTTAWNPKALNFAIWDADSAVAGNIPGTVAQPFGGEGEGYQVMAPFEWVVNRDYRIRFTKDLARGARWFSIHIIDTVTGVETYHGSIRANPSNGSDVGGVSYQWTELFSQPAGQATTCPLLPQATIFFGTPDFSILSTGTAPTTPTPAAAAWLPTGENNPNNHTTTTVYNALVGRLGSRLWSFRYELLNNSHARIMDLPEVLEGEVVWQYLADIKRQGTFKIRDLGRINYLSDRLRPWVRLHLPPFGTNDWVEWPMGVFLLNSPNRHAGEFDTVDRNVTAFDPTWAMEDDKVTARTVMAAGANLVNFAATQVATSGAVPNNTTWIRATRSTETAVAAKEWPPGTSRRQIANDVLSMAGFESISFDGLGRAILQPYKDPNTRPITWTYQYGDEGLIIPDVDQELDLFNVPNRVLAVVSEPDQPMLVASKTNTNPASITSTIRRGRTITEFLDAEEASSQTVLQAKVDRRLREHAQIYEHLVFQTSLMPIHGFNDVLWISYDPLGINTKYHETSWTATLQNGEPMRHEARRLVAI